MGNTIQQYAIVKFNFDDLPEKFHDQYPFQKDKVYIFHGEIPNMPGHCVVSEHPTGVMYSGYHTEDFIELDVDET
jgi:hypothetical protein